MDSSNAIVLLEDKLQTNRIWYGMLCDLNEMSHSFLFQDESLNIQSVLFHKFLHHSYCRVSRANT
jgi:hypothetical protein